jgi:sortase B
MERDFFEAHPLITVITDDAVFVYEIFSVFHTHIDFDYIRVEFESRGEFGALVEEIVRRRVYDTWVTADGYDNVLILSTCTNITRDTRLVVAARLAKVVVIR